MPKKGNDWLVCTTSEKTIMEDHKFSMDHYYNNIVKIPNSVAGGRQLIPICGLDVIQENRE
jgi:hypothetical protein